MDHKLKVRVGQHEFEAEGPQDWVDQQFAAFQGLIKGHPTVPPAMAPQAAKPAEPIATDEHANTQSDQSPEAEVFARIFRVEGEIVSLTALPQGEGNEEPSAALLLLFGQKLFRGTDLVSGEHLLRGLQMSGYTVDRADRVIARIEGGLVMRSGKRRGVKYRLSLPGLALARTLAQGLAKRVP
jgi:hypothetical protein